MIVNMSQHLASPLSRLQSVVMKQELTADLRKYFYRLTLCIFFWASSGAQGVTMSGTNFYKALNLLIGLSQVCLRFVSGLCKSFCI